jgi:hypothetical protein
MLVVQFDLRMLEDQAVMKRWLRGQRVPRQDLFVF